MFLDFWIHSKFSYEFWKNVKESEKAKHYI